MPLITCPECDHQMRVADEHQGKKVRCKQCETVFVARFKVEAAKPKAPVAKKPEPAPAAKPPIDEDKVAYGVTETELSHRCPFCTLPMESEDAIVCLNCGYNLRTRSRPQTKKVYEPTTQDYLIWLSPGIAFVIVPIILLVICLICYNKMNVWLKDSFLDNGDGTWIVKPNMFSLYIFLFCLFVSVPMLKFAYKRLVKNNRPPEVELKD